MVEPVDVRGNVELHFRLFTAHNVAWDVRQYVSTAIFPAPQPAADVLASVLREEIA